jgi:hypothetical protein
MVSIEPRSTPFRHDGYGLPIIFLPPRTRAGLGEVNKPIPLHFPDSKIGGKGREHCRVRGGVDTSGKSSRDLGSTHKLARSTLGYNQLGVVVVKGEGLLSSVQW